MAPSTTALARPAAPLAENRIARLCGGAEGAAGRRCVGRIFKAVVVGLPAAPTEQRAGA
jgi:hypothetical protein